MVTHRLDRVNELLKREISELLLRTTYEKVLDFSSVTITHVVTSHDLRHARVLVSVLGDAAAKRAAISALYKHRKHIQDEINRDTKLKYTPRLSFELDESLEQGDRVLRILESMEQDDRNRISHEPEPSPKDRAAE